MRGRRLQLQTPIDLYVVQVEHTFDARILPGKHEKDAVPTRRLYHHHVRRMIQPMHARLYANDLRRIGPRCRRQVHSPDCGPAHSLQPVGHAHWRAVFARAETQVVLEEQLRLRIVIDSRGATRIVTREVKQRAGDLAVGIELLRIPTQQKWLVDRRPECDILHRQETHSGKSFDDVLTETDNRDVMDGQRKRSLAEGTE